MNITNRSTIAEYIITALIANGVEPQATHTASQGRDWGFVAAYLADDNETYAIQYGANGDTIYDMANDITDLALWLITDDADTVACCNARDEDPETVADDYTGPCHIISARYFNGPTRVYGWITEHDVDQDNCDDIYQFDTKSEALDWIDAAESEIYHLAHNESGRPVYFIVSI
jgi:hypothetical protein